MKTVVIMNKTYEHQKEFRTNIMHDSGPFFHNDRFLNLASQTLDQHVKKKSIPLYYFMNWWFYTTNHKLDPDLSRKKMSIVWVLVNLFFILCIIGLIACILAGIAKPILTASFVSIKLAKSDYVGKLVVNGVTIAEGLTKTGNVAGGALSDQFEYIPEVWRLTFKDAKVIAPLLLTIFFFFFSFLYIYMQRKIRPATNKLNVEGYLVAKMNLINHFKWILKRQVKFVPGIKEQNHRLVFNMKPDYNLMRVMNYIYGGLHEMNIMMVIDFDDDKDKDIFDLQKTIKQDFDNLTLIVLSKEKANDLVSIYQNGRLSSSIINVENNQEDVDQNVREDIVFHNDTNEVHISFSSEE
ncbi:hypothetical protein OF377_00040 [Ureaplasma sp. ES3154-GEN]|uniref:hypothetical protein n=1 Tax=Ureaplasma sp. ES3154-GEN TaxID=2984844 RepID=UPI0021E6F8FC|nr:hypothetical protein [Ureaplasma sp. ES3154-GEN]MCV3743277.1 hypothetical protein [Ureaplasma sp. ES3154-GEN]